MKNVHVYDILNSEGVSLADLIIQMDSVDFTYLDIFDKVQGAYMDDVDSYSYSVIEQNIWARSISSDAIDF